MTIVRTLSNAEKEHHSLRHSHIADLNFPCQSFGSYKHDGSLVLTAPARYGSKLNRVENFGLDDPVTLADVQKIEDLPGFSRESNAFYMCEYAHPSAFSVLEAAGYAQSGCISVLSAQLDSLEKSISASHEPSRIISQTNDIELFVKASFEGFREGGRSPELLDLLSRSAAARTDTKLFIAKCDNAIAASAAMAILQIDGLRVAMLYIDSTIPHFRGRGLHRALIQARLQVANEEGCDLVMASARSGSTSAANLCKEGLRHAYESLIYSHAAC